MNKNTLLLALLLVTASAHGSQPTILVGYTESSEVSLLTSQSEEQNTSDARLSGDAEKLPEEGHIEAQTETETETETNLPDSEQQQVVKSIKGDMRFHIVYLNQYPTAGCDITSSFEYKPESARLNIAALTMECDTPFGLDRIELPANIPVISKFDNLLGISCIASDDIALCKLKSQAVSFVIPGWYKLKTIHPTGSW